MYNSRDYLRNVHSYPDPLICVLLGDPYILILYIFNAFLSLYKYIVFYTLCTATYLFCVLSCIGGWDYYKT